MKSILISIKSKYVAKILNGEKTLEIRKSMPKCDLPIDVYIYCTKDGKKLVYHDLINGGRTFTYGKEFSYHENDLNGKVVAKFTLNKVEEIYKHYTLPYYINEDRICKKSCLTFDELRDYLKGNIAYAWHISNLVIFDEPKKLSDFSYNKRCYEVNGMICETMKTLTKAPQSWCYVEKEN